MLGRPTLAIAWSRAVDEAGVIDEINTTDDTSTEKKVACLAASGKPRGRHITMWMRFIPLQPAYEYKNSPCSGGESPIIVTWAKHAICPSGRYSSVVEPKFLQTGVPHNNAERCSTRTHL